MSQQTDLTQPERLDSTAELIGQFYADVSDAWTAIFTELRRSNSAGYLFSKYSQFIEKPHSQLDKLNIGALFGEMFYYSVVGNQKLDKNYREMLLAACGWDTKNYCQKHGVSIADGQPILHQELVKSIASFLDTELQAKLRIGKLGALISGISLQVCLMHAMQHGISEGLEISSLGSAHVIEVVRKLRRKLTVVEESPAAVVTAGSANEAMPSRTAASNKAKLRLPHNISGLRLPGAGRIAALLTPVITSLVLLTSAGMVNTALAHDDIGETQTAVTEVPSTFVDYKLSDLNIDVSQIDCLSKPITDLETSIIQEGTVDYSLIGTVNIANYLGNAPNTQLQVAGDEQGGAYGGFQLADGTVMSARTIIGALGNVDAANPLPGGHYLASNPFNRVDPLYVGRFGSRHPGTDYIPSATMPYFFSMLEGTVVVNGPRWELGDHVIVTRHLLNGIRDKFGTQQFLYVIYGHASGLFPGLDLNVGDVLPAGVELAHVGHEGRSSSQTHLHVGMAIGGVDAIDVNGQGGGWDGAVTLIDPTDIVSTIVDATDTTNMTPSQNVQSPHNVIQYLNLPINPNAGKPEDTSAFVKWATSHQKLAAKLFPAGADFNFSVNVVSKFLYANGRFYITASDLEQAVNFLWNVFPDGKDNRDTEKNPFQIAIQDQVISAMYNGDNLRDLFQQLKDNNAFTGVPTDLEIAPELTDWPVRANFGDYFAANKSTVFKNLFAGDKNGVWFGFVENIIDSKFGSGHFPTDWADLEMRSDYFSTLLQLAKLAYPNGVSDVNSTSDPLLYLRMRTLISMTTTRVGTDLQSLEDLLTSWSEAGNLSMDNVDASTDVKDLLSNWPTTNGIEFWWQGYASKTKLKLYTELNNPLFLRLLTLSTTGINVDNITGDSLRARAENFLQARAAAVQQALDVFHMAYPENQTDVPVPVQTRWGLILNQLTSGQIANPPSVGDLWQRQQTEKTNFDILAQTLNDRISDSSNQTVDDSLGVSNWPINLSLDDYLNEIGGRAQGELKDVVTKAAWETVVRAYMREAMSAYPSATTLLTSSDQDPSRDNDFWIARRTALQQALKLVRYAIPGGAYVDATSNDPVQARISMILKAIINNTDNELDSADQVSLVDLVNQIPDQSQAQQEDVTIPDEIVNWPARMSFQDFINSGQANKLGSLTNLTVGLIDDYINENMPNLPVSQADVQARAKLFSDAWAVAKLVFKNGKDDRATTASINIWKAQNAFLSKSIPGASSFSATAFIQWVVEMQNAGNFDLDSTNTTTSWPVAMSFNDFAHQSSSTINGVKLLPEQVGIIAKLIGQLGLGSTDISSQQGNDSSFIANRLKAVDEGIVLIKILFPAPNSHSPFLGFTTKSGRLVTLQFFYNNNNDPLAALNRFFPEAVRGDDVNDNFTKWLSFLGDLPPGNNELAGFVSVADADSGTLVSEFNTTTQLASAGG